MKVIARNVWHWKNENMSYSLYYIDRELYNKLAEVRDIFERVKIIKNLEKQGYQFEKVERVLRFRRRVVCHDSFAWVSEVEYQPGKEEFIVLKYTTYYTAYIANVLLPHELKTYDLAWDGIDYIILQPGFTEEELKRLYPPLKDEARYPGVARKKAKFISEQLYHCYSKAHLLLDII